jgi:hypothetical protein
MVYAHVSDYQHVLTLICLRCTSTFIGLFGDGVVRHVHLMYP